MSAVRFRFTGPGIDVTGPVQGNGGLVSSLGVLTAQQGLAQAGRRLGVYEPATGCVCVFPDYNARDNGRRVNVPLSAVSIEPASVAALDALILAELERCDRLGVEPGADHMRLVSERRKAASGS